MNQFEQVGDAKRSAARRHHDEGIRGGDIGPGRRERGQAAFVIVEVDTVLSPIVTVHHQSELASVQGMKRMRDAETLFRTLAVARS